MATYDEGHDIMTEARQWYATTTMWSDVGFAARTAVAEFIANQRGLTLYAAHLSQENS